MLRGLALAARAVAVDPHDYVLLPPSKDDFHRPEFVGLLADAPEAEACTCNLLNNWWIARLAGVYAAATEQSPEALRCEAWAQEPSGPSQGAEVSQAAAAECLIGALAIHEACSRAYPTVPPTPATHAILTKLKAGECLRHSI